MAQALYVSVLTNKLNDYIPAYVAPAAIEAGLPQSSLTQLFAGITVGSFADVPGITDSIIAAVGDALKLAYTEAFKIVFCKYSSRRASPFPLFIPQPLMYPNSPDCTIPFSVLLIISAIFVPNMEKFLGSNVARRLQTDRAARKENKEKTTRTAEV